MLKKKTQGLVIFKRVTPLLLIVALLVPVLLAVPVSAATVSASGTCGANLNWFYYSDQSFVIFGSGAMDDYSSTSGTPYTSYYRNVKKLTLNEGITYIGNYGCASFGYDGLLTSVTLPSTVTAVGVMAFFNIQGLTELNLNEGLITIGDNAFGNCSVSQFIIPSTVTSIGQYAFSSRVSYSVKMLSSTPPVINNSFSTSGLTNIYVPCGSLSAYQSADGWSSYAGYLVESEPEIVYPSSAETPTFTTNLTGATYYYLQGVTADPLTVEATVSDGGTLSYEWYQDNDTTMTLLGTSSTFYPPTDKAGTFSYHCKVTNKVYNPNVDGEYLYATAYSFSDTISVVASSTDSTTPEETTPNYSEKFDDLQEGIENIPGQVTDGMQDIVDQENAEAEQQGSDMVDQITNIVPNDSQGFIDAMGSLVSALSYDGTNCVLPIPALTLPAIDGLFPSYTVMQAQEVDFEEFFAMMPPGIMLLVQSLLTVALIVYCFKELYDTVSYFFVLKGGKS